MIRARTGTSAAGDQQGEFFLSALGPLGYMTTAKGTPVTFALYVDNIAGLAPMNDLQGVTDDVNDVAVLIYKCL